MNSPILRVDRSNFKLQYSLRSSAPYLFIAIVFLLSSMSAMAKDPDCAKTDRWPTTSAFIKLKNAGLIESSGIDPAKTKTSRLASEKLTRVKYRQIHHIVFTEKLGRKIEVITSNIVSNEECSESGVEVFVISVHLSE